MADAVARGVRKVSEQNTLGGRAVIITKEQADKLTWANIPVGTICVVTAETAKDGGRLYTKLEGETDWVPVDRKNDGTVWIDKDAKLIQEVFEIDTLDDGTGATKPKAFSYYLCGEGGAKTGSIRHSQITEDGDYVFSLEKGSYLLDRHHLTVFVDDSLRFDVNDGVKELTQTKFSLNTKLSVGSKITAQYLTSLRIGHPYPRIYSDIAKVGAKKVSGTKVTPDGAEEGDFWLDNEYEEPALQTVAWKDVTGKPSSLASLFSSLGFEDNLSRNGHYHRVADIIDFPVAMPANGGNADAVQGHVIGTSPGNIVTYDKYGKIPTTTINIQNMMADEAIMFIQDTLPNTPRPGSLWFDTTPGKECIKVFNNDKKWTTFSAVWKE